MGKRKKACPAFWAGASSGALQAAADVVRCSEQDGDSSECQGRCASDSGQDLQSREKEGRGKVIILHT